MKKYECIAGAYIYDPAEGDPENGVAPNTPFEKSQKTGNAQYADLRKMSLRM